MYNGERRPPRLGGRPANLPGPGNDVRNKRPEAWRTGGIAVTTLSLSSARPAPGGPRPLRWTCAEFHRFGDLGVFVGRRAMLIDGVILEQGPMSPPCALTLELV